MYFHILQHIKIYGGIHFKASGSRAYTVYHLKPEPLKCK
jgi:hypothetical protein